MVGVEPQVDLSLVLDLARQQNDEGYARFICKFPFPYYVERVKRIGFVGKRHVIDVGCGFGQWTAALALLNRKVVALEQNPARLSVARELVGRSGITNVEFVLGDALSLLDRDDGAFDALFCYGVFMFLDRRKAMQEFARVLSSDGEIYICTNAFGWWLQLWLKHLFGDRNVRQAAYRAMIRGNRGGLPNYTDREDVADILSPEEWDILQVGHEGTLSRLPNGASPAPAYRGTFLGFDSVIEFLARKKGADSVPLRREHSTRRRGEAAATFRRLADRTLSQTTYEYNTPLREFPQPRPARDPVNNCSPPVVQEALALSRSLHRVEQLRWLYYRITASCRSQQEHILACLRFAQCHFFHHFAGQPMQAEQLSVLDPVAGVILGFGRCGTVARFLVDLFACNGLRARLLTADCHTAAEVLCQGRWLLADANLFPPGIHPTDESGNPVSLDQVAESPSLLDRCPSFINYHHEYIEAFLKEYPEADAVMGQTLRTPLLPSSVYFGDGDGPGRVSGRIERLSKLGSPEEWNADQNFGWLLGYQREILEGPVLSSRRRPGQVTQVSSQQDLLCWDQPARPDSRLALSYRVTASQASRGWDYAALPIGCTFSVVGHQVRIDETRVPVKQVATKGRYITIQAEVREWQTEPIFYLPSREFDLEKVR